MPTLLNLYGLKFFFYSNEHLPIHIHVRNADGEAKFNLEPIELLENRGLKNKDLKRAETVIEERREEFIAKWNEIHN